MESSNGMMSSPDSVCASCATLKSVILIIDLGFILDHSESYIGKIDKDIYCEE